MALEGSADCLLRGKTRPMVERYVRATAGHDIGRIFEPGIFRGGSTAFLHALYGPRKLVAISASHMMRGRPFRPTL